PTEITQLALHDLLTIYEGSMPRGVRTGCTPNAASFSGWDANLAVLERQAYTRTDRTRCGSWSEAGTPSRARRGKPRQTYIDDPVDRKSTRLNCSHTTTS